MEHPYLSFLQSLSDSERRSLLGQDHSGKSNVKSSRASNDGDHVGQQHHAAASSGTDLLRVRLATAEADRRRVAEDCKRERQRCQQLQSQVSSLQSAIEERNSQLDAMRAANEQLRQQLQHQAERTAQHSTRGSALRHELEAATAQLRKEAELRSQLEAKLQAAQARVTELQHSYVATVASCVGEADAVEARDVLRRARLAGLERDAAAGGAVGPPEADPWDRRPAAKAAATIASLTRERDVLQQRVGELAARLAEVAGREGAARGAAALRGSCWRKTAVAAEARLAAALKRVKELGEEQRRRDTEAKQRDRYIGQLERTLMAQHRTLQKQKRMLEGGGMGVAGGGGSDAAEHSPDGGAAIDPDACGQTAGEPNLQTSPPQYRSGVSRSGAVGGGVDGSARASTAAAGPGARQPVGGGADGGGALLLGWQGRGSVAGSVSVHEGGGSSRGPAVSLHRTYCPDAEGGSSNGGSVAGDRGGEDGASAVGASGDPTAEHERWRQQGSRWDDGGEDVDRDEGWAHGSASEGEGGELASRGWGGVRDEQAGAAGRGWAGEVCGEQGHRVLRERLQQQRQKFIAEMHSGLYEEQQRELQVEQQQRQRQGHEKPHANSRPSEGGEARQSGSAPGHLLAEQYPYHRLDQNSLPGVRGTQSGQRREARSLARRAGEQESSLRPEVAPSTSADAPPAPDSPHAALPRGPTHAPVLGSAPVSHRAPASVSAPAAAPAPAPAPAPASPHAVVLQAQLTSMEASLQQLYRELEGYKSPRSPPPAASQEEQPVWQRYDNVDGALPQLRGEGREREWQQQGPQRVGAEEEPGTWREVPCHREGTWQVGPQGRGSVGGAAGRELASTSGRSGSRASSTAGSRDGRAQGHRDSSGGGGGPAATGAPGWGPVEEELQRRAREFLARGPWHEGLSGGGGMGAAAPELQGMRLAGDAQSGSCSGSLAGGKPETAAMGWAARVAAAAAAAEAEAEAGSEGAANAAGCAGGVEAEATLDSWWGGEEAGAEDVEDEDSGTAQGWQPGRAWPYEGDGADEPVGRPAGLAGSQAGQARVDALPAGGQLSSGQTAYGPQGVRRSSRGGSSVQEERVSCRAQGEQRQGVQEQQEEDGGEEEAPQPMPPHMHAIRHLLACAHGHGHTHGRSRSRSPPCTHPRSHTHTHTPAGRGHVAATRGRAISGADRAPSPQTRQPDGRYTSPVHGARHTGTGRPVGVHAAQGAAGSAPRGGSGTSSRILRSPPKPQPQSSQEGDGSRRGSHTQVPETLRNGSGARGGGSSASTASGSAARSRGGTAAGRPSFGSMPADGRAGNPAVRDSPGRPGNARPCSPPPADGAARVPLEPLSPISTLLASLGCAPSPPMHSSHHHHEYDHQHPQHRHPDVDSPTRRRSSFQPPHHPSTSTASSLPPHRAPTRSDNGAGSFGGWAATSATPAAHARADAEVHRGARVRVASLAGGSDVASGCGSSRGKRRSRSSDMDAEGEQGAAGTSVHAHSRQRSAWEAPEALTQPAGLQAGVEGGRGGSSGGNSSSSSSGGGGRRGGEPSGATAAAALRRLREQRMAQMQRQQQQQQHPWMQQQSRAPSHGEEHVQGAMSCRNEAALGAGGVEGPGREATEAQEFEVRGVLHLSPRGSPGRSSEQGSGERGGVGAVVGSGGGGEARGGGVPARTDLDLSALLDVQLPLHGRGPASSGGGHTSGVAGAWQGGGGWQGAGDTASALGDARSSLQFLRGSTGEGLLAEHDGFGRGPAAGAGVTAWPQPIGGGREQGALWKPGASMPTPSMGTGPRFRGGGGDRGSSSTVEWAAGTGMGMGGEQSDAGSPRPAGGAGAGGAGAGAHVHGGEVGRSGHQLMALLGQASADLQLLSSRLGPLVKPAGRAGQ